MVETLGMTSRFEISYYTNSVCHEADGTVFWGKKGVLMVEFMQHGATSEMYCGEEGEDCAGSFRTKGVEC
jgi:hypothetical protein